MRKNSSVDNFDAITLDELRSSIWRHKWSIVLILCVLTPLLLAVVMLIPPRYDSQAQLLVRLGRGSVSMDPATGLTRTVSIQESRLAQVNSVRDLLTSRAMAERVVKRVGAQKILEPQSPIEKKLDALSKMIFSSSPKMDPQGELSGEAVQQQYQLEEACEVLMSSFENRATKDAYTINLQIRSGSPFLSRELLAAYIDEYQEYHIKAFQSSGSLEFFEEQSQQARQRAMQAQERLRSEKTEHGIIELASAKIALRETISVIERELLTAESELVATYSEISQLREELASLPRQVDSEVVRGIPKQAGTGIRQSLYALEIEYRDMASKLKADHPKLKALREQLDEATKIAFTEIGDEPQTRQAINPTHQQLELAYRTALATHAGLTSKRQTLDTQLATLGKQLVELNETEVRLTQLGWDASLTETEYLQAERNHLEARQVASLDRQKMNEISVVQDATLGLKKSSPQRAALALLSLVFVATIAFGQAIIRGLYIKVTPEVSGSHIGWHVSEQSDADDEREATIDKPYLPQPK